MDSKQFNADHDRIQQLFESLFSNAIEHNTENITVSVGTTESSIYIEDDGTGITDEKQELIFDPGYTTKNGQTGFGLTIAQQVALSHGWEITVENGDDGGLRFEISGITFEPKTFD
jgi:signal transduction histidine kinase